MLPDAQTVEAQGHGRQNQRCNRPRKLVKPFNGDVAKKGQRQMQGFGARRFAAEIVGPLLRDGGESPGQRRRRPKGEKETQRGFSRHAR